MRKSALNLILACAISMYLKDSVAASIGDGTTLSTEEMRDIITAIPEAERDAFIRRNIDLGYRIEQLREQLDDEEEARLAVQIFHYFVDNQEAIRNQKRRLGTNIAVDVICYPEPIGCIDPDDAGIRPI